MTERRHQAHRLQVIQFTVTLPRAPGPMEPGENRRRRRGGYGSEIKRVAYLLIVFSNSFRNNVLYIPKWIQLFVLKINKKLEND